MRIIDAQLHEIGPALRWDPSTPEALRNMVLGETTTGWMDATGVQAAVLNATRYGTPDGWGEWMAAQCPERFVTAQTLHDPLDPGLAREIATIADRPGLVAFRVGVGMTTSDPTGERGAERLRSGVFEPMFAACEAVGAPLFCHAAGNCTLLRPLLAAFPQLVLIVDHIGLPQPPLDARDTPPWRRLDELLQLAEHENVAVKLCGAPALSERAYPHDDTWPHLRAILDAFGSRRVMWASDAGRFGGRIGWDNEFPSAQGDFVGRHSYADSLGMILHSDTLSASEKEHLLGATVRRVLSLPPAVAG